MQGSSVFAAAMPFEDIPQHWHSPGLLWKPIFGFKCRYASMSRGQGDYNKGEDISSHEKHEYK
jgi:hypothetical protein